MLFNSYEFLALFLPLGLLAFYAARRVRWEGATTLVLLILSVAFYTWHPGPYWYVLFLSIIWNYLVGNVIAGCYVRQRLGRAKWALVAGVGGDLLALAYFKYASFIESSLGLGGLVSANMRALPLGISFYTFTQIAYLVDLYRGQAQQSAARDYSLFVMYFPHLIAGPIIHHKDIIPQFKRLAREPKASDIDVLLGSALLSIGLFKKVVIADTLSPLVAAIFISSPHTLGFSDSWLGALSYTMQIYFDFSAYSDMALGISVLFGVKLPINFWSPYKATSIIDFWRRWHISLSSFLRDYIYIPLGGNRSGPARRYLNIFVTMLIGGVWHGAGATFIVWGAMHGCLILVNHAWRAFDATRHRTGQRRFPQHITGLLSWAITFFFVVVTWVVFRAPDMRTAVGILTGMVEPSASLTNGTGVGDWFTVSAACAIAWLFPNAYEITGWLSSPSYARREVPVLLERWRSSPAYAVCLGMMLGTAVLFIQRRSEFLYWQF